jgi:hypothetical protein
MITEKGTLPIGVEFEGITYTSFELRPQTVRDNAEVLSALAGTDNPLVESAHVYARRISIDGIPKEKITPDTILDMDRDDFEELLAADERLKKNRIKKD